MTAEPILLIDDDPDCWTAVRLALGPEYSVLIESSRHSALRFLAERSDEIRGVIVDLNLTEGHDNFGRSVLEVLREMNIPSIVFSSNVTTAADAERFANEFGVLDTIRKRPQGMVPVKDFRLSVKRMVATNLERQRFCVLASLVSSIAAVHEELDAERTRVAILVDETHRAAGKGAATRLQRDELKRIEERRTRLEHLETEMRGGVAAAESVEALRTVEREVAAKLRR